jgi:hypothetical protein
MILKRVKVYFCKLDPDRPDLYDPKKPAWSLQIRTESKAQKKEWADANLNVKPVDPDEGPMYYRVSLKKRTTKKDGSNSLPVEVTAGNGLKIDPNTIGNGSVCNLRLWQYEYPASEENPKGGIATQLQGVQVVKHLIYKSTREDFEEDEYEAVQPEGGDDPDEAFEKGDYDNPTPAGGRKVPVDDADDDIPF